MIPFLARKVASSRLQLISTTRNVHRVVGTFGDTTHISDADTAVVFRDSRGREGLNAAEPLVLLFGWAGATPKNLDKYGSLYRNRGIGTLEFILPTRFIFRHTEQVSEIMTVIYSRLKAENLHNLPTLVHCLSDTGVMSFQGFCIAAQEAGDTFMPKGIVWDSCPGPRPHVTLPRMAVLTAINWLSRVRDGMSLGAAVTSSYVDFRDLGWKNFIRRTQGLETKISTMDDVWCGFWARDLNFCKIPELFFYSKSDFYLPYRYLEKEVLPVRQKLALKTTVCTFEKSPHVGHLRINRKQYEEHVAQFCQDCLQV